MSTSDTPLLPPYNSPEPPIYTIEVPIYPSTIELLHYTGYVSAGADYLTTTQGTPLIVAVADIVANDSGGNGSPLTITSVHDFHAAHPSPSAYATLRDDGTILFTPDPRFVGDIAFDYMVTDGVTSDFGTIHLSVPVPAGAPSFTSPASISVRENSPIVGTVEATDTGGGPVTYSLDGLSTIKFEIDAQTGVISMGRFWGPLDYEASPTVTLGVVASNAAGSNFQLLTINVIDIAGRSIGGTSSADRIDRNHGVGGKTASDDGDRINGMGGDDRIKGLRGDDTLIGGSGNDTLTGGEGRDLFVFKTKLAANNVDRVTDFDGLLDRIQLDNDVMTGLGSKTGELRASQYHRTFDGSGKAHDRSDRIIYDEQTHKLFYDGDGTGSKAAVLIATFDAPALGMLENKFDIV